MPQYIKTPLKITLIIGIKSQKVAGNKERFERKNRLWSRVGVGVGFSECWPKKKNGPNRAKKFFWPKFGPDYKGDFEFFFFVFSKKKRANKSQNGQHSVKPTPTP